MHHDYKGAIDFKLKSASYHYEECIDAINRSAQFKQEEEQIVAISSEITAMMLVYQSTLDVLAQLINDKRKLKLNIRSLYFSTIIRCLNNVSDLKNDILKLKLESVYIIDYCNTVKHRNLIYIKETQVHQTAMIGLGMHMGVQTFYHIDSFEKDKRQHNSKSLPKYANEIHETLPIIINKIMSQL